MKKIKPIVISAIIAAIYTVLTLVLAVISYGPIQFRVSEALTVFACVSPYGIVGVTLGCFISNLLSPNGIIDALIGSSATLVAGILAYVLRNITIKKLPLLSIIMPAIINSIFIGAELCFLSQVSSFSVFVISALEIGLSELAVCLVLGIPTYLFITKNTFMKNSLDFSQKN